jgi:hypothetical protein
MQLLQPLIHLLIPFFVARLGPKQRSPQIGVLLGVAMQANPFQVFANGSQI